MAEGSVNYAVDRVGESITRIRLGAPELWPDSVSRPTCVYAIDGESPGLVNVGHPVQQPALKAGLRAADIAPESISRVVYNAWSIELVGGATAWPDADHFVWSDDMVRPHGYRRRVSSERQVFEGFARELLSEGPFSDYSIDKVTDFAESFWPEVSDTLDLIPVANGHRVQVGKIQLEVVGAPGPAEGHVALWDDAHGRLFPGHIVHRGMPERLADVQSYIVSLERLIELEPEVLWPVRGEKRDKAEWALTGAH